MAPDAVIAQEEIFGPVVAVMKARDMDEALAIANGTQYALTGGLISRSPATIARVRREFLVGNLYINRGTTGALVERQAFGGFKMSGIGSKAGGPDYLAQFMGGAGAAGRPRTGRRRDGHGRRERAAASAPASAAARELELTSRRTTSSAGPPPPRHALKRMSADERAAALARAARLVRQNGRELQAQAARRGVARRRRGGAVGRPGSRGGGGRPRPHRRADRRGRHACAAWGTSPAS